MIADCQKTRRGKVLMVVSANRSVRGTALHCPLTRATGAKGETAIDSGRLHMVDREGETSTALLTLELWALKSVSAGEP